MAQTILLIIVLILAALALIVAEICTPMFGLLAALALGCAATAVYLCWTIHPWLGVFGIVAAAVGLPVFAVAAVKILPRTVLGRRLALKRDRAAPGEGTPEANELQKLIGRETTARTVLRPAGTVRIDGRRIIAQAESGMIEKGATVKIIRAEGNRVIVRKADA